MAHSLQLIALYCESKDKWSGLDVIKKRERQQRHRVVGPFALLSLQDNVLVNLGMQLCKLKNKMTEILTVWVHTLEIPCRKNVKNYKANLDVKS